MEKMIGFFLNEQRYGLTASSVARVIPVVYITPVPDLPDMVLGIINMQGQIIPVFNLKKRLGLSEREVVLSDKLIVTNTNSHSMAFLVDKITDLIEYDETHLDTVEGIFSSMDYVKSVVKLPDGIVLLLQDPEYFLENENAPLLQKVIHHG